ncbi:MAG TPA: hypothetical protein VGG40_04330 [Solirubrobacterales bacterium]
MPSTPSAVDSPGYPRSLVSAGHVEPSPRRLPGVVDRRTILDTRRALYVLEKAVDRPRTKFS